MRFLVSDIKNAGRLDQTESMDPTAVLGKPPEFVFFRHPIKVRANAAMTGADIVVSGHVATTLGFTCGRCLEGFEKPYEADFQQVFNSEQKEIDLSNDIQEVVYIDLPLTPVCREDCKGLCSVCGKNKNLASCQCEVAQGSAHWDALKQLRFH